jgi:hypothetical protein
MTGVGSETESLCIYTLVQYRMGSQQPTHGALPESSTYNAEDICGRDWSSH